MPQHTYEIHLRSDATGSADLDSPVRTDRLDFYDSGVWTHTDDGRDCFPYERVQVIRERPAESVEEAGESVETAGEPSEAAGEMPDAAEPGAEPEAVEE